MKRSITCLFVMILLLPGCSKVNTRPTPIVVTSTSTETSTPEPPTATLSPTNTTRPSITPTIDPAALFKVSSPLEDIQLNELPLIISNPFSLIGLERDDGHHGTDFAYWSRGTHTTMVGLPIHSVLTGRVAGVINDILPYGNLIIIETSKDTIPVELRSLLSAPVQQTPYPYNPRLKFCTSLKNQSWLIRTESLYLLYGHMLEPSPLRVGETVQSGEKIGLVGTTGLSVNAHLHLEMRWGPGGTEFASMNYQDTAATQQEMDNYCEWRISGKYVLMDPMIFFNDWLSLSSKTN
jgi:murein DD-endopeptidase MepM/ murein hydrolase activator NlpD